MSHIVLLINLYFNQKAGYFARFLIKLDYLLRGLRFQIFSAYSLMLLSAAK